MWVHDGAPIASFDILDEAILQELALSSSSQANNVSVEFPNVVRNPEGWKK